MLLGQKGDQVTKKASTFLTFILYLNRQRAKIGRKLINNFSIIRLRPQFLEQEITLIFHCFLLGTSKTIKQ